MIPKAFLVTDMQRELGELVVRMDTAHKRLEATKRVLELHAKRLDALRKRMERQSAREKARKHQHDREQDAE